MIQIQCPACQKTQPEAELMIDSALKQRCNFCGAQFEVNITKSVFSGSEKISGKLVSKGLLDNAADENLVFKVEPKVRTMFAIFLFCVGMAAIFLSGAGPLQTGALYLM